MKQIGPYLCHRMESGVMRILERARRVAALGVAAVLAACSCPDEQALAHSADIDWNGWTEKSVTSKATGESYSYLHLPSSRPDAPVMVLVPGLLLDARTYLNAAPLSGEFELVAWDTPEDSSLYGGRHEDMALALKDFLDAMGIRRMVLAGTSLGGIIALEFMKHRGDIEVDALVLIDSQVLDATEKDRRWRIRSSSLMLRCSDRFLGCLIKRMVLDAKEKNVVDDPQHDVFNVFEMRPVSYYRHVSRSLLAYDGDSGARLVTCPTLVLHGSEDALIDVEKTRYTLEFIPQAHLEIVEGAGHDGIFSHADEFVERILDWWRSQGGAQEASHADKTQG
jgi:pimeloyl-ACP methyl ester carboxylesterase